MSYTSLKNAVEGILMHDPSLDKTNDDVILRESQKKFEWNMATVKGVGKFREHQGLRGRTTGRLMGICRNGESRPFVYGKLNKQYILTPFF